MNHKIPITVGIVGHLDAIITDEHKKILDKLFNDISIQYPNSPITLFSQLAKGADTEVAKQFIEIKEKTNRDYNLIIPIPFNDTEYKKEFNETELKNYTNLISKAERSFVLENNENLTKPDLYRKGGQFVADSSIILIAIWDKNENNKKGGTAEIVKYKIEGSFKNDIEQHIFDLNGSLIELKCNRENSKDRNKIILEDNQLKEFVLDKSIEKSLRKIDDFNSKFTSINKDDFRKSLNDFYPNDIKLIKPNTLLKNIYCVVDTITLSQQKSYKFWLNFFFGFGLIILLVFEIYKHKGLHPYMFYMTLLLIATAFSTYKYSNKKRNNHKQFIEDRIIAEGLRIQFFWNISDIKEATSNHILRIHKTEYNWIKHILLSIYGYTYNGENNRDESVENVKEHWIVNQRNWFEDKLNKNELKQKNYTSFSKVFFWLGILLLSIIACFEYYHFNHSLIHWLIVADSVIFGIYALSKAYTEKQGFEQIENQYSLMKSVYEATENRMNEIEKAEISIESREKQFDELFYLAGKEALIENGNWYLIFKDKDLEVEGVGG
jgi:hypothetical protein